MQTSRCGVGINQKERCLLPQIRASNCITDEFINEHEREILNHDAFLVEGYFLQEKYDLCHSLCVKFKNERKIVILTLSAVFMVKQHNEKILEIANYSDIIVGNNDEYEELGESQGLEVKTTLERVVKKFKNKEKLFIMTSGNKGVFVAKYNAKKGALE
jgi:adenosine kinase